MCYPSLSIRCITLKHSSMKTKNVSVGFGKELSTVAPERPQKQVEVIRVETTTTQTSASNGK